MKYTHRGFRNVIWHVVPALLASLAVAGSAYGNTVVDLSTLMNNPSFEAGNQPTAPGNQVGCPVGWVCGGSPAPGGTSYQVTPSQYVGGSDGLPGPSSAFPLPLIVPNGSNVGQCPTLLAGSCTLYQLNLGTYQANTTYTLTLWVGTPLTVPNCGTAPGCVANVSPAAPVSRVTAYFLGTGNAQLQATNIPVPAPGQWIPVPLSFMPTGYQVGQTINFLIFASTSQGYQQVNFDVDPPSTLTCPQPPTNSGPLGSPFGPVLITVAAGSTGAPPFSFSIASSSLGGNQIVPGLTLNNFPPDGAFVGGTPTAPGNFTVHATDGLGVVSANACAFHFPPPV